MSGVLKKIDYNLFKLAGHIIFFVAIMLFSFPCLPQPVPAAVHGLRPLGFIIKFNDNIGYVKQVRLLSGFEELYLLTEKENALMPKVSFARFTVKNFTEEEINNLKKELEQFDEVVFVNILNTIHSGHFAAPLGEIFVKLFSKEDYYLLERLAGETKTQILREYHYMPGVFVLFADKNSMGNSREVANYFNEKKLFEYASPNMMFSLEDCSPNDSLYNRQWSIENTGSPLQFYGTEDADMDIDSAWAVSAGDSTIKIAVLDSGVDTTHVDLAGNLLPGFDATGNNSAGYPNTTFPQDGHGTNCAGIIAAVANNGIGTAGVANKCKIIPVKVFFYINFNGTVLSYSTSQWGLDAFNWAYQTAQADIMSNSWAIPDSLMGYLGIDTLVSNDAINDAVVNGRNGKGIPMLFSAGNAPDTFCLWPARTPATIAVAATTMCDELKTNSDCSPENWSSNHGIGLDISAPGVKIATTDIMGNKGFTAGNYNLAFNGTSAACPNAAGVMALILSANKNLTALQAREIISNSCEKVGNYDYSFNAPNGTWSMELGYGRVNAFKAVQLAVGNIERPAEEDFSFFVFSDNSGRKFLNYKLISPATLKLEIFDVLGRQLKTIHEGIKTPGSHQVEISSPGSVPGIYFMRIQVNQRFYSSKFFSR